MVGRTALVTGAGSGLGRAIALALGAAGARVLLVGRNATRLTEVAGELADLGAAARTAECDVSSAGQVGALAARLAAERVSILVNNAGIPGPVEYLTEIDPAEWDEVFAINVRGIFLMCRAFVPAMVERHSGDVINLASVSGKRPLAPRTPYTASKAAVIGLTTALAYEVGPLGVSVNSLSPGPVRGARMERVFRLEAARTGISYEEAEEAFISRAALHRLVEEEEVGAAVIAMLHMPGLCAADVDLSAGMVGR